MLAPATTVTDDIGFEFSWCISKQVVWILRGSTLNFEVTSVDAALSDSPVSLRPFRGLLPVPTPRTSSPRQRDIH